MRLDRDALIAELRRVHDGTPWHGPSRAAVLDGITPEEAAWRPAPDAHSIWEIVLHMRNWTREVARRAQGGLPGDPVDGDWPAVPAPTAGAWADTLASLDAAHALLLEVVRLMPLERLASLGGTRPDEPGAMAITNAAMFLSLAQHDVYHTGQLAVLRRLARMARMAS
jgi:uncharacterized damage-inducible protein DinB